MTRPDVGIMFRCQNPPEMLPDYVRRVEKAGFDELWVVEDCFFAGGVSAAAVALASAERLKVGLGIVPAVARNAAFAAMEFAALARLYPGRFLPGIGHGVAGWMRQVGAMPDSQLTALEEVVSSVKALLRGETLEVSGEYVKLDEVCLDHPPQSVPPVSTGVRGPKSLALSGRVADGTILAECAPPAYVAWAREKISEGAAEADRQNEEHRLMVYAPCKVDRDSGAAKESLRPVVAETLVSGGVGAQISPLGITEDLEDMIRRGGVEAVEKALPDEWLDQLTVVGNPDECVAAIDRLGEAGADAVVLVPSIGQPEKDLDDIARELMPLLVEQ